MSPIVFAACEVCDTAVYAPDGDPVAAVRAHTARRHGEA